MENISDQKRIGIFLGFAFGIAWTIALIIALTGGFDQQQRNDSRHRYYPGTGTGGDGLYVGAGTGASADPLDHQRRLAHMWL